MTSALGFTASIVVPNDADPSVIEHAQLLWPEGGGIVLGSANRPDNPFSQRPIGAGAAYVVTSQPDEIYERAVAAGAGIFAPLETTTTAAAGSA